MAKLHKIELYIVDSNDTYGDSEEVVIEIDNNLYDGQAVCFNNETVEFKWEDDIDINKSGAGREVYEKYFKE